MSFSLCGGAASKRANGGVMMHVADNPALYELRPKGDVPLHHVSTAGAATAVGTAVGLAVSVPVAVIQRSHFRLAGGCIFSFALNEKAPLDDD